MSRWVFVAWLAMLSLVAGAADHGTILLYHRIADTGPDATRVSPNRFAAHLDLIDALGYRVVPLADLLNGVFNDGALPERAVALTFDDAYRSVGDVAYPMLRERNMPFTVFVATDVVDEGSSAFLDWSSLQRMTRDELVSFGPHSKSHAHLESQGRGSEASTAEASREEEIDGSLARLREQLGDGVLDVFAYPYGEYSRDTESMLARRGLFGLAQQSGPVGAMTSGTRIPRFPMYLGGDSDARLKTALSALPLPAPGDGKTQVFFAPDAPPPREWKVEFAAAPYNRDQLRCYAASGDLLEQRWKDAVLFVSLPAMGPGRNKVNCTAPSTSGNAYHWYSRLWLIADKAGQWLQQ